VLTAFLPQGVKRPVGGGAVKVHLAPIDIRSGNQGKVQRTRRLLASSRGQWACEAMIRSFPGPFVNLPRGPVQMGLSWWCDPETRIPDNFFLFSFYNTGAVRLEL
jgi:hypothetical protein